MPDINPTGPDLRLIQGGEPVPGTDPQLQDLYLPGSVLLISDRLSDRAHDRYGAALWYAWGRDDAGDHTLRDVDPRGEISGDFAFATFCALEAEHFERQHVCNLRPISDQYRRFISGEGQGS